MLAAAEVWTQCYCWTVHPMCWHQAGVLVTSMCLAAKTVICTHMNLHAHTHVAHAYWYSCHMHVFSYKSLHLHAYEPTRSYTCYICILVFLSHTCLAAKTFICTHINLHAHVCMYVYIYIMRTYLHMHTREC